MRFLLEAADEYLAKRACQVHVQDVIRGASRGRKYSDFRMGATP
jgi:hypothetical protein